MWAEDPLLRLTGFLQKCVQMQPPPHARPLHSAQLMGLVITYCIPLCGVLPCAHIEGLCLLTMQMVRLTLDLGYGEVFIMTLFTP